MPNLVIRKEVFRIQSEPTPGIAIVSTGRPAGTPENYDLAVKVNGRGLVGKWCPCPQTWIFNHDLLLTL